MSQFKKYAQNYGCTVAEAISDRDWPMTYGECVKAFIEAEGRKPTGSEVKTMHPESSEYCDDYNAEIQQEYNSIYG